MIQPIEFLLCLNDSFSQKVHFPNFNQRDHLECNQYGSLGGIMVDRPCCQGEFLSSKICKVPSESLCEPNIGLALLTSEQTSIIVWTDFASQRINGALNLIDLDRDELHRFRFIISPSMSPWGRCPTWTEP